ncbi:membrane protein [Candidatus Magnetobacterium bavaricum]|uniref:Membrane protein n=1 Tax=Candidatus Magnetobacterium bavaricum TaxID=29290 RepID=A0A0F3GJE8_9BACT|nr:membrane protein [Candidatus Magnetobacterium bavaricum]
MKSRKVVLLEGFFNPADIRQNISGDTDVLAVTPASILACDIYKQKYIAFDSLYNAHTFRKENLLLIRDIEFLFGEIDNEYKKYFTYPRAFTGNIYPFIVFFASLLYISRISESIKNTYQKISYIGTKYPVYLSKLDKMNFRNNEIFYRYTFGIDNMLAMLQSTLIIDEFIEINTNRINDKNKRLNNLKNTLHFGKHYLLMIINSVTRRKTDTVFIFNINYEVLHIKEFLKRDYNIIHTSVITLLKVRKDRKLYHQYLYSKYVDDLIEKWTVFRSVKQYILKIFRIYHDCMLTGIESLGKSFNQYLHRYNPHCLIHSTGAITVIDDLFCFIAENRKIPIFYFQHAGATSFHSDPYNKYCDYNENIKKINILYSVKDFDENKDFLKEGAPLGSVQLYEFYHKKVQATKDILYCPGIFAISSYKEIMRSLTDLEKHRQCNEVLDIIYRSHISADIKIHVIEEDYYYCYFINLLNTFKSHEFRLLKGFKVEKIMKDYKLLILDFIGSQLIALSILIEVPVILYIKDKSFINKNYFEDVLKIFYVVESKDELGELIDQYKKGMLEPKFNIDMVKKYAFPDVDKNPKTDIYDYIKNYKQ